MQFLLSLGDYDDQDISASFTTVTLYSGGIIARLHLDHHFMDFANEIPIPPQGQNGQLNIAWCDLAEKFEKYLIKQGK